MKSFPVDEPWSEAVQRAASVLYRGGATAVWLFGSRARQQHLDRLSDFDLAVEGLPDGARALEQAEYELRGKVDIVRVESATPTLRWGMAQHRFLVPRVPYIGGPAPSPPLPENLAGERIQTAARVIREVSPRSVIDLGCGLGWLLAELAGDEGIERLTGVDFDADSLDRARHRVARASGQQRKEPVTLHEGLITHRDPTFRGHDVAVAIEVIEHLEPEPLAAFVGVLFAFMRPRRIVITTPNREYNILWFPHRSGFRHPDHRFEWSRTEFSEWAKINASDYGYDITLRPIGSVHPLHGSPTQMAVFDLPGAGLRATQYPPKIVPSDDYFLSPCSSQDAFASKYSLP